MARIRTVKPEFWESETIASLSRDARLLFICTLNLADDEGLLRWTAPFLKSSAFMYDDDLLIEEVSELMRELVVAGLILPYTGGKLNAKFGWIISFHEHQKINRPTPSKLPPPSLQNRDVRAAYAARDKMTCQISGKLIESLSERYRGDTESLSLDHIKPKSKGGSDYPSNIRCSTQKANKSRGNTDDDILTEGLSEPITTGREGKGKGKEGNKQLQQQAEVFESEPLQEFTSPEELTERWQPEQTTIQRILMLNIPEEFIHECIPEFVGFWLTANKKPFGGNYENAFFKSTQRAWVQHQNIKNQRGNGNGSSQQFNSGPDQREALESTDWLKDFGKNPFSDSADAGGRETGELVDYSDNPDFSEVAGTIPLGGRN